VCRVLHSFARLFRSAKNEQQTSAFVKAMQSMLKDDVIERSSVSPRAAPEQRSSHLLRSRGRRACVAPCEPGRLQSNRGRKWPSPHDVLSRTPEAGSTRFARFTSPKATDCVETRSHVSHGRDPMVRTEHARTAPNTYRIRSEFGCWKLRETRSRCRHQAGREPRAARR
jgi:hypothetical protein